VPTPLPTDPAGLLARALAADPSRPLLTFYDDATGERTELSVATFANWVAKTANLVRDDLDLQPGNRVEVDLPLHWQAAVWLQACWALDLVVMLPASNRPPADLAVVTHDRTGADAAEVVSLGLGPMGLARPGRSPAHPGALDYDREVHGHGDRFAPSARALDTDALDADGSTWTGTELVAAAAGAVALPAGGRLLVTTPLNAAGAVVGGLLVPLATQVTAVLCRHLDVGRLDARVRQENVVAALAEGPGPVPSWAALPGS